MKFRKDPIAREYRNISRATSNPDAEKAYVTLHQLIEADRPSVERIEALGKQVLTPNVHFKSKIMSVFGSPPRYFRGSGIIVVGNSDGEITHADYGMAGQGQASDPVAEQYPGYQRVALRKLGQAALLGKLGLTDPILDNLRYATIEDVLVRNDLKADDAPHHLGYAVVSNGRGFLAAGASGMLPSDEVAEEVSRAYADELNHDREQGWVDWEYDEFAGFHDLVAASTALDVINGKAHVSSLYSRHDSISVSHFRLGTELDNHIKAGHNVH